MVLLMPNSVPDLRPRLAGARPNGRRAQWRVAKRADARAGD